MDSTVPLDSSVAKPQSISAAEPAPPVAPSLEKRRPIISIVEKSRAVVLAAEPGGPFLSIVENPPPGVAAVEPHGAVLRTVEKLRPVMPAVEKPRPIDAEQQSPEGSPETPAAPAPESPIEIVPAAESVPQPVAAGPAPPPTAIRYSRTRTFAPSTAWLESNRIVDVSGSNAAAAAFRMLRTQVLQRMLEHHWRSIAVLSPGSDEGRTTTAINLAISLANDQRHTVLLVEFDLKQPIIAKRLGIDVQLGADDILRGEAVVEDCLYHPEGFDRFVVMPGRAPMERSSEMLTAPRCREIVTELRARYPDRLLVFDLPPVLGTDDALAFLPLVECALIVVAEGSTPRADLLRCVELLRNTPVIGTVLNLSSAAGAAYG